MFPGFSKGSVTFTKDVGFREIDASLHIPKDAESEKSNSSEITYHYLGGVLNLKGGEKYDSQYRWFPIFKRKNKPVLMCRCLLKDFGICKKIKSVEPEDLILDKFPLPRVLGFYASYGQNPVSIKREDGRDHAFTCDEDKKLLVTVTEYAADTIEKNSLITNKDPYAWQRGTSELCLKFHNLKKKLKSRWPTFFDWLNI